MPETSAQLEKIVGALSPEDTAVALERVRKCHAPTLREENRKKTQTFLGLLLHRFEVLAGTAPLPVAYLDVVSAQIAAVAATVPFFAATAARARLEKMSARLRRALRDGDTGWPPARTLLLLSLFADLFPTTDKSHPVTTPAALYLGNVLAHCAVRSRREAVVAVVTCALAASYSAPAGRVFPEATTMLAALVHGAGAPGGKSRRAGVADDTWAEGLPAHVVEQVGGPWLAPDTAAADEADEAPPLSLASVLACAANAPADDPDWLPNGADDRHAALRAAVATLRVLVGPAGATASARELLAPVSVAADRLLAALDAGATPKKKKKSAPKSAPLTGTLAAVRAACESLRADVAAKLAGAKRAPLAWRAKKTEAIKQFNPMYEEEGYQKGRDYDPNRERAEQRRLQRQLRQEARGAVRELRKDNRFLAEQRATEAAASAEERGERQRETLAFLEKMEGDLKSGGQGGMIVKTQRRVNGGGGRDRKKR